MKLLLIRLYHDESANCNDHTSVYHSTGQLGRAAVRATRVHHAPSGTRCLMHTHTHPQTYHAHTHIPRAHIPRRISTRAAPRRAGVCAAQQQRVQPGAGPHTPLRTRQPQAGAAAAAVVCAGWAGTVGGWVCGVAVVRVGECLRGCKCAKRVSP